MSRLSRYPGRVDVHRWLWCAGLGVPQLGWHATLGKGVLYPPDDHGEELVQAHGPFLTTTSRSMARARSGGNCAARATAWRAVRWAA